ncbi:hypothetical protein CFE70_001364 [Pyrenophora teres f. teres 0-1]
MARKPGGAGEVEHALRSDKAVREAVAVLQQHDGSEARLAGFVTVHEDAEIADEQDVESRKSRHLYSIKQRLTELLEAQLPAYMVPQTITILDAMPVNQNGKADRKALEQQIGTQEGQSGLKPARDGDAAHDATAVGGGAGHRARQHRP